MKLEDQVCSIEPSKKLKELGVKHDSLFYWSYGCLDELSLQIGIKEGNSLTPITNISAFTVAELGEMLPKIIEDGNNRNIRYHLHILFREHDNDWLIKFERGNGGILHFCSDGKEADARAKMLIYLKEKEIKK